MSIDNEPKDRPLGHVLSLQRKCVMPEAALEAAEGKTILASSQEQSLSSPYTTTVQRDFVSTLQVLQNKAVPHCSGPCPQLTAIPEEA